MKRAVVLVSVLVLLGGIAYGTSGQGRVDGTLLDEQGQPLSNCQVDRDLRLGIGFGGFDGLAYGTGRAGEFSLPVNRGFNRLTFTCGGGRTGAVSSVVWRGRDSKVTAVLDGRYDCFASEVREQVAEADAALKAGRVLDLGPRPPAQQ